MSFRIKGEDYNRINTFPYVMTQIMLKEYHKYLTYKENELILDVGCGTGNVTVEVLLPYITHLNIKLVGIDILPKTIDFAKSNYKNDPRLSFRVTDITEKNESILKSAFTKEELNPGFDKVFSFSVINWTRDHEQSLKNIYTLLRPGGQCLLWFTGYFSISEIYRKLRVKEKYQKYLQDLPAYEFAFHYSKDTQSEVNALLKKIGFTDIICRCVQRKVSDDMDLSDPDIELFKALDPHLQFLPDDLHFDYLQQVKEEFKPFYAKTGFPYERINIVASKPLQVCVQMPAV